MSQTATLEMNGRRYDALTGRLVTHSQPGNRSVDGIVHAPAHRGEHAGHHLAAADHRVHHVQPHHLQHSNTLMRHSVHRPLPGFKRHLHSETHTGSLVRAVSLDLTPKHSIDFVDPARLKLAHQIHKSKLVSRFTPATAVPNTLPTPRPVSPVLSAPPASTPHPLPKQPSADIFERALQAANSHHEPYHPIKHKKSHKVRNFFSAASTTLGILLLVGFIAYQNASAIQLKVVSSRAGINATLPAWQPSGFKLGALTYGHDTVTASFNSLVTPSNFIITQTSSNWDSNTLLSDFVNPNNETYNTISADGSTIYTYGNNDATWVSGGIWYKLSSHGVLSTSQIVNIATSMQS